MQKFLTRPVVHNDGIMRNCTDGDYYRKDDVFLVVIMGMMDTR